jgi:hypothetical protein
MHESSAAQCLLLEGPRQPAGWTWNSETGGWCTEPAHQSVTCDDEPESQRESGLSPLDLGGSDLSISESDDACEHRLRMVSVRFAQALVETLDGKRSLTQLQTFLDSPSVLALAEGRRRLKGARVRLGSVRVQPRSQNTAEVAMRLATVQIDYAAALRVTHTPNGWTCTDLVMG